MITRDFRKRVCFAEELGQVSDEDLYGEFDACVKIIAAFLHMKQRTRAVMIQADNALIKATVLRERIHISRKYYPLPTYLKSRKQIWAVANDVAKQTSGEAR